MDTQFHNLTLLQRCGSGAYGEVWLCRDVTEQLLALKRIPKDKQIAELKGITALRQALPAHPNVLTIHHVAEDEDCLWYTMDAADNLNDTLEQYLPDTLENRMHKDIAFDPVQVMQDLFAGVTALHNANVVHRDIKPGNVLFIKGRAVLGDVGLTAACTTSLSLAGTIGFLPPEIRDGSSSPGTVGKAGDLYALGMVLYCMLTGNEPESFPSLPTNLVLTPQLQQLNLLADRMCDHNKNNRLTSEEDIKKELDSMIQEDGHAVTSRKNALWYRHGILRIAICILIAATGIVGTVFLIHGNDEGKNWQELQCSKQKQYSHTHYPISMTIPGAWQAITAETFKKTSKAFASQIPSKTQSKLKKLYKKNKEYIACSWNGKEVAFITISAVTAHYVEPPANTTDVTQDKNGIYHKTTKIFSKDTTYQITLTAAKEQYDKLVADYDNMIKTFIISNGAKK